MRRLFELKSGRACALSECVWAWFKAWGMDTAFASLRGESAFPHPVLCWLEVKLKAQMCSVTSLGTIWMRALEVSGGNPAWSEINVWCSSQMQWAFDLSVCTHLPYSFIWIRFVLFFMLIGSLSFWSLNKSGRWRCFFPPLLELTPVWRGSLVSGLGADMAIRVFSWLPELLEAVRPWTGCLNHPKSLLPNV